MKIEIIVNSKGETTVTTRGFTGVAWQSGSGFLEDALGQRLGEAAYCRVPPVPGAR